MIFTAISRPKETLNVEFSMLTRRRRWVVITSWQPRDTFYAYRGQSGDVRVNRLDLDPSDSEAWDKWLKENIISLGGDEPVPLPDLPQNCIYILFIPRTEDIPVPGGVIEADFIDLPIKQEIWDKISRVLYWLPGHISKAIMRKTTSIKSILRNFNDNGKKEALWMYVAMIARFSPSDPESFALASTHFNRTNLTLAIMIGCSVKQMKRVEELIEGSEDVINHPLLVLGICAELQLDRLEKLVDDKVTESLGITRLIQAIRLQEAGQNREITGTFIDKVHTCRDESKRAGEEVKATKRQLTKALSLSVELSEDGNGNDNNNKNNATLKSKGQLDMDDEVTNMFSERFEDIFAEFDTLITECRIVVEEMSLADDFIRSELARQEAKNTAQYAQNSAQEAKASTTIAFVAILYLPVTTTATIFAMPVFQFQNNWRDWRYQPADATDPPVFSGYFWLFLGISVSLTMVTIGIWWRFRTPKDGPRPAYRGHKILKYIRRALSVLWLLTRSHLSFPTPREPSPSSRKPASITQGSNITGTVQSTAETYALSDLPPDTSGDSTASERRVSRAPGDIV
ncbi:hypothetical protein F5884DRAFT_259217 [Xylogone sp. PMI_703]|nr:hypothetical protein F5884DRAFT_259217 [Xylogone sp. PMI_703]